MIVCDLCDSRQDVVPCRIELPHVRDARGGLDLCMKCQQKIFSALELFAKQQENPQDQQLEPNPMPLVSNEPTAAATPNLKRKAR